MGGPALSEITSLSFHVYMKSTALFSYSWNIIHRIKFHVCMLQFSLAEAISSHTWNAALSQYLSVKAAFHASKEYNSLYNHTLQQSSHPQGKPFTLFRNNIHPNLILISENAVAASSWQQAAVAAVVTAHKLLLLQQQQIDYTYHLFSNKFGLRQQRVITMYHCDELLECINYF